jgi:HK97 family phage portal protein
LRGVSPILSANLDLLVSEAAMTQQALFFKNMARPSFVIESNDKTTPEQVKELRAWWDEWSQGEGVGKSPILGWGFRARQMQSSAVDAQLAELLKMTDQNIALTMRVPLQVLGIGGAPFASTELLMQFWYANGLGFCLNHIEEAFGNLFGLRGQPDEYLEFNTKALLRSAWREMIEGLGRATISGIMSPDEARDEIDLPEVPGGVGAMPRVQQQVVPLSYGADLQPPKPGASTPAAPAPPDNQTPPAQGDGTDAGKASVADLAALLRASHERHSLAA